MSSREFSRTEYRRSTGWPQRIVREWPFLEAVLARSPPDGLVIDAGCGSGEHARFLAGKGYRTVGIDASRAAVEDAAGAPSAGETLWARADVKRLPVQDRTARAVLCLGNTLALLGDDAAIRQALCEFHRVLLPGGALLIQILNYFSLRRKEQRHLPINFRTGDRPPGSGGHAPASELVYLRLMDFQEPDHVWFHVICLERSPGSADVVVRESVVRRMRSLEHDRLQGLLEEAGFRGVRLFGDYRSTPFEPLGSTDVLAVAERP